ncbi:MAG: RNA polymerase II holoenzyme cyclin-like subunit [Vezdaea acicularis]|nr:MAG: RNA polymerase II holoenzyme cyclin-like subunit [Vezdaea acicularis]
MAANYWVSTQRLHWQFTREKLAEIRQKLEDEDKQFIQQFPLPERRLLSMYFNKEIIRLGKRLTIPTRQQAIATAQVYVRRFYTKVEIRQTNPYLVMATALYLACKMEECPQHIRFIASEARQVWTDCLYAADAAKLGECEFSLISEMNSQLIVHQPYRTLAEIKEILSMTTEEAATASFIINDHYLTDLPLLYPPHIIAVTAAFLAVVLKPNQQNHFPPTSAAAASAATAPVSHGSGAKPSAVPPTRAQQMVTWLAQTNIDMEAVIDSMQEIISLYEALEQYNDKVCKDQISRYVKNRGIAQVI